MVYVFNDGRIMYDEKILTDDDKNYIAVDKLPDIPQKDGKIGYLIADMDSNKIVIKYIDNIQFDEFENNIPVQKNQEVTMDELKELHLISLQSQAEMEETRNQESLIMFEALAEIVENMGV